MHETTIATLLKITISIRKILVQGEPYLCLFATTDILAKTELRCSYGDREKVNYGGEMMQDFFSIIIALSINFAFIIFSWIISHQSRVCITTEQ